ncbi:MAG TPA: RNA polymerase subunit sigma-70 [Candidatus Accumulibacter sp.]|nr:RNA polymerase subunit sigma-70 [Accumulibacter sp.]HCN67333.1 RNA polymerase subunit sigma-70 [Accumulibacter sp.]HCV14459.1 RNA polymerase subunit sigma-70 [Accumulibacter sp.]
MPCLLAAWSACEGELQRYLRHRLARVEDADELLQEVFIKAWRQGEQFCAIDNRRAWLFRVAHNALADHLRTSRESIALPDDLAAPESEAAAAVDELSQCLPRVLAGLSPADRLAITLCDIGGAPQRQLADQLGISLAGAKSRIQRARRRLREALTKGCRVRFDDDGRVCGFTPRPPL